MANNPRIFPMFRPIVRYVEFRGRSDRQEFWLWLLFYYLVVAGFAALILGSGTTAGRIDVDRLLTSYMRFAPLLSLFNLAVLMPNLAVRARRLHDLNRTAWWIVFPYVVSAIAYVVFFIFNGPVFFQTAIDIAKKIKDLGDPAAVTPVAIIHLEWPLWQLLLPWVFIPTFIAELMMWVAYAWPGVKGTNRFGPSPQLGAPTEVF